MAKSDPLPEKYRKALSLIKEGSLSYRDIAKTCGINESNFYDLMEGSADNLGTVQEKFSKELAEINKQRDKEIRDLIKTCKKKTFVLLDSFLSKQKHVNKNDRSLISTLTAVANALSKSTPNVEIGSFTYQKGLSPEDIYAEFKRLSGLASDRRTVQGPSPGGAGEVPVASGSGTPAEEESEDTIL